VEVVHDPAVLITSGLDSASAPDRGRALHLGRDARPHRGSGGKLVKGRKEGRQQCSRRRRGRAATPDWGLQVGMEPRRRIGGRGRIRSGDAGLDAGSESLHNTGWSAAVALEVKGEGAAQRRWG
jgi:hypothetical protein